MSLSLADIHALFLRHDDTQYTGEPATQLEHALQTAALAEQAAKAESRFIARWLACTSLLIACCRCGPANNVRAAARP